MNTLLIVVLLIEVALGLLLLGKMQSFRFLSGLFFLSVVAVVFVTFFVESATIINMSENEMPQDVVQTGSIFQAFSSAFLSLFLLFFIVVVQRSFLVLYHALMGGLLGFVVLHVFFEMMLILPSLVFYEGAIDVRSLIIFLIVVEMAYLVGLAAVVGQDRRGSFLSLVIQYSAVFSIFLTMALFQRPLDASLLPYENLFALVISLFCGLIFFALFQKKWWLPAAFVLVGPLFFVVSA